MKPDTRPRPAPERVLCSRIAQLADCPGDVVDAEAEVVEASPVLFEPRWRGVVDAQRLTSWSARFRRRGT